MKEWKNRTTLPIEENTGTIIKIQMDLFRDGKPNEMRTINMGSHLMTNYDTEEITICQFNGNTITYGMGHTYSSPATLQEIADWAAEKIDENLRIEADYQREMLEEDFLQRSGNVY
jgi:hypothetical protein